MFTWTLTAAGAGTEKFTSTASGTEGALGGALTATASGSLAIQTAAVLTGTASALPFTLRQGQTITVTFWVANTGQAPAVLVSPTAGANPIPTAAVAVLGGPVPAGALPIAGGATQGFTWTYAAVATGSVAFVPAAGGVDGNGGWPVSAFAAVPWSVTVTAAAVLKVAVALVPARLKIGETIEVRMTVTNTGASPATAVGPSLLLADPAAADLTGGPVPGAGQTLAAGASVVYVWTLTARRPGGLTLTASATGQDGGFTVGASALATATVAPRFDDDLVTYPSPVNGDRLVVALRLEGDADEVRIEVYTVAYRKVWSGRWTNVRQSDGEVQVDAMLGWAPGPYWLKATAMLAGGTQQSFTVAKVVVKR